MRRAGPSGDSRSTVIASTFRRSASSELARLAPATTWAPARLSARVIASPIPRLAPVTTATFPARSVEEPVTWLRGFADPGPGTWRRDYLGRLRLRPHRTRPLPPPPRGARATEDRSR